MLQGKEPQRYNFGVQTAYYEPEYHGVNPLVKNNLELKSVNELVPCPELLPTKGFWVKDIWMQNRWKNQDTSPVENKGGENLQVLYPCLKPLDSAIRGDF